jgi:hypothetical protein
MLTAELIGQLLAIEGAPMGEWRGSNGRDSCRPLARANQELPLAYSASSANVKVL